MTFQTIDPATGEPLREWRRHDDAELESRLERTRTAQRDWALRPVGERAAVLARAAELLERDRDAHAETITSEMGKPLAQARSEIEKCAWACRHYAETGPADLEPEPVAIDSGSAVVAWRPLGVVLAIMPWNFPYWQVVRFAAPNLVGGNAGLLKHSDNTAGCAEALEELFLDAGAPAGVFTNLRIDHDAAARVIEDPRVAAVTLTGSTRAGRSVAGTAGRALKKVVLELGGSDPYLVLEDADLDLAAEKCASSRLLNAGQSCIAAKRFLVVESVAEDFTRRMAEQIGSKTMGPPREEGVDVGPMARVDLRDELARQVEDSVAAGARRLVGAVVPDRPGAWLEPGVLADVRPGMPAFDEELFGPVASVVTVADEDEAVELANRSDYGLGGAVFTRDLERGRRIATERLEVGSAFVNDFVKSDPRLPFGGVKDSGHGRELGVLGLRELLNAKTVVVASS